MLSGQPQPEERSEIIRRRLAFDADPQKFCAQWDEAQTTLRERCQQARPRFDVYPALAALLLGFVRADVAFLEDVGGSAAVS